MSASPQPPPASAANPPRNTMVPNVLEPGAQPATTAPVSIRLRATPSPLPRRRAPSEGEPAARVAWLRARIREAQSTGEKNVDGTAQGDEQRAALRKEEADATSQLALALIDGELDFEDAIAVGTRSLELREDESLRERLIATCVSIGASKTAALLAREGLSSTDETADVNVDYELRLRRAALLVRAGDPGKAVEALRQAAAIVAERTEAHEQLGALHWRARGTLTADGAAREMVAASRKYRLRDSGPATETRALEALARAFEIARGSALAATSLADAIEEIGRFDASDAVRAEHAEALGDRLEDVATVQAYRRERAHSRRDAAAALAATLDELVSVVVATSPGTPERQATRAHLDTTLDDLPSLLISRRRLRARIGTKDEAATAWREIAAATSVNEDARTEARAELAAIDLADEENLAALRATTRERRDPTLLVEALVRGLSTFAATGDTEPTIAARAAELAMWADEHLRDPALAAWAWERVLATQPDDATAKGELARLAPRVSRADARHEEAKRSAETSTGAVRDEARREIVTDLLGRVGREAALLTAIEALLGEVPGDKLALDGLDRIAFRLPASESARALRLREEATSEPRARARVRVRRAEAALAAGDLEGARQLLSEEGPTVGPEGAPLLLAIAERTGGRSKSAKRSPGSRRRRRESGRPSSPQHRAPFGSRVGSGVRARWARPRCRPTRVMSAAPCRSRSSSWPQRPSSRACSRPVPSTAR